jgi:hypothetical protein
LSFLKDFIIFIEPKIQHIVLKIYTIIEYNTGYVLNFFEFFKTSELIFFEASNKGNLKTGSLVPELHFEFPDEHHVMIPLDITEYTRVLRVRIPWITTKNTREFGMGNQKQARVRTEDRGVGGVQLCWPWPVFIRYLGILIHYWRLAIDEWKQDEERLQKRLSSWKGKLMSLDERLTH